MAVPCARLAIVSDVPVGAGPVVLGRAGVRRAGARCSTWPAPTLPPAGGGPALAQRAENDYVGMPCGIMDQSASTLCRDGHALFLDCRSLAVEHVPFDLAAAGLAMLVIDTRAPHRHAGGEYAARRATCEAAAAALGVPALRDVTDLPAALAALPDDGAAPAGPPRGDRERPGAARRSRLLRGGRARPRSVRC